MSINVEELKIKISTNIPGKSSSLIDFKRSLLHHPELSDVSSELNELPYFTFDVTYPLYNLRYLTYRERIEFFFNKEKFTQRLLAFSKEKTILDIQNIETEEDQKKYYKKRDYNIQTNVLAMIELIFPTKFPVTNDMQTSYDFIKGNGIIKYTVLDPMVTNYYSYFKINDEIYTVKKNIWINDVLNHPVYQRLVIEYRKMWVALQEAKLKRKRDIKFKNLENDVVLKGLDDLLKDKDKNSIDEELKKYIPREYDVFSSIIVNDYKTPIRESSNTKLQTILNSSNTDTNSEFYEYLNYLYDSYFYLGKKETSKKKEKEILKVGMSFVNLNILDAPKKEIYIYIDFIKGELVKKDEKKIWCPYVGDYLGNQLESMILNYYSKGLSQKKIPNWNIFKNRMMFSIKDSKSEKTEKLMKLEEKPLKNSGIMNTTETSNKRERKKEYNINVVLKSNFLSFIFKKIDEVKNKLDKLNEFKRYLPSLLTEQNLLELIYNKDKDLYKLIEEWNKNLNQNRELIKKLNKKISELEGDIKNAKDEALHQERIKINFEEINKQKFYTLLFSLFLDVANVVLTLESQKKAVLIRGGTKKRNNKLKREQTRKNKKK